MTKKSTSKLFDNEEATPMAEDAMNLPEVESKKEVETKTPVEDDIQDIDLSIIKKKRFRINGDPDKILELNVSDMGIAHRLSEAYPELNTMMDEVADTFNTIPDGEEEISDSDMKKTGDALKKIDDKMREQLDYIFNAPVSEMCGGDGSMWDPIEGAFRYEHIIEALAKLYENNFEKEFKKIKRKVDVRAEKYKKVSKFHN